MKRNVLIALLSVLIFSACVTQRVYDDLLSEKVQMESDLAATKDSLQSKDAQLTRLLKDVKQLQADTAGLGSYIRKTKSELNDLRKRHDQLSEQYNSLLSNSSKMTRDIMAQQESLLTLKENLERSKDENEALEKDLAARELKVKELEDVLAKKDEAVQKLKGRISQALLNFKENDLNVEVKNGKVYVSLAEQLLFGSGSTVVDPKGAKALKQLASAIKDQSDIHIMVEGHTDDVPISRQSAYLKDNWDLSVLRATAIIRILTSSGISSDQITAAGRGEFVPVAKNESAEGRQKNRRTEIVITPDLDELFQILESN